MPEVYVDVPNPQPSSQQQQQQQQQQQEQQQQQQQQLDVQSINRLSPRAPLIVPFPPPPPPTTTATNIPVNRHLPFRQHLLWSGCLLIFMVYLTAVLYFFLMSPTFRTFVVNRANTLFALPYILSLLVVLLCLAPCSPTPARPQLDAVITSPSDCALVLLVLLEWATCLSLVLVTLIAVHDHLSYVSPDGLIVPADNNNNPNPNSNYSNPTPNSSTNNPTNPNNSNNNSYLSSNNNKIGPHDGDGISHDAVVVLIIPILLMYCLFNCLLHLYSCLEAAWRAHHHYTDLD